VTKIFGEEPTNKPSATERNSYIKKKLYTRGKPSLKIFNKLILIENCIYKRNKINLKYAYFCGRQ
jgi:hypothetical protein